VKEVHLSSPVVFGGNIFVVGGGIDAVVMVVGYQKAIRAVLSTTRSQFVLE